MLDVKARHKKVFFFFMKLTKTTHQNEMENEFLLDYIVVCNEREITDNTDSHEIID